jgi:ABC-2 type transport system permease protein
MIRAILRAQWLSMRTFRLASSRRGAVFSLLTAILWYGFWTVLAIVAEALTSNPGLRARIEAGLPVGLLAVFAYWQLAPLASATLGASLDLRKLLVYPVPRRSLFLVEVMLRVTTCAEMLLLLAGASIGLLRNPAFGAWRALPRVLPAMAVFVAFNLLLAAGLRSLLERLLARRHIREALVFLLVLASALPQLLVVTGVPALRFKQLLSAGRNPFWPWVAAARSLTGVPLGMLFPAGVAVLAGWTALAYAFARWQFARSLRYDAQAMQATVSDAKEAARAETLYRLPSLLLPDPLGAIVEKEIRSLRRTPRFRLVFVMGFSFGLILWLPMALRGRGGHSPVAENFLVVVSVYALTLLGQVTYWNSFGFDRSAVQVYFSAPVSIARTLAGKNIAASVFVFLEIAAVTAACSLLHIGTSPGKIAEAFLITAIAALYLMGLGNLSSVYYPRAINPQRVSAGGAASRFQGVLFLLYPVALLPVFLAYLARYAFKSQLAFYLIVGFAAALGVAIYGMAMESASHAARARRETMLMELSRGEGPVVAE